MKTPMLHCRDGKIFTIEDGIDTKRKIPSPKCHTNIFMWFIAINIILLLIFCGYALWSLYQLENAMQSREEALSLERYFERFDSTIIRKDHPVTISPVDESVIISDFQEWKQSILKSLEDLQENGNEKVNEAHNLKFLLHSISNIIRNLLDHDNKVSDTPSLLKSEVIITNLTDLEFHILKEFTKLKILENNSKLRFPRTVKGDNNDSGCNLQFSIKVTNNDKPVDIDVKPANKGEGMINISNNVNYVSKGKSVSDVRECSFNIIYKT